MELNRRDFLVGGTCAAGAALSGCLTSPAAKNEHDFIWAYLVHFGSNSWKDVPLAMAPKGATAHYLDRCVADHVRFDEPLWREVSGGLRKAGCNTIIIDLAEIVRYESHPELAVRDSWSVEKLRGEIARLRGMGFEVIPKMNFSCGHDSWLGEYHRMVSTRRYYQVCADLINEVSEIFDRPRLFHLGYDEETAGQQHDCLSVTVRQGELWWHDFLWFAGVTEKAGCRPWIWSDYEWQHKDEFLRRMPKSVLQSNWYYESEFDVGKIENPIRKRWVSCYEELEKAGFDQAPCGGNWACSENFGKTVAHCDRLVAPERLKGYVMAPWQHPFMQPGAAKSRESVEIMAKVIRDRRPAGK